MGLSFRVRTYSVSTCIPYDNMGWGKIRDQFILTLHDNFGNTAFRSPQYAMRQLINDS